MWSKPTSPRLGSSFFSVACINAMVWWSVALRKNIIPTSFLSENLNPITSVQNFVLRWISLTLSTTWPIFLIFIGDLSSAIYSSFLKSPLKQENFYHGCLSKAKLKDSWSVDGQPYFRWNFATNLRL